MINKKLTKKEYNRQRTIIEAKINEYEKLMQDNESKANYYIDNVKDFRDTPEYEKLWKDYQVYEDEQDIYKKALEDLEWAYERRNWTSSDYTSWSLIANNID